MDSGDIDAAVLTRLGSDATLAALMPDGVWFDMAPANARRFVIVSLFDTVDVPVFGGRAIEEALYAVRAVGVASASPNMKAAALRIDELLADTSYPVAGFSFMASYRDEPGRIRRTEVDQLDASIVWYHRGAHYRVEVARQ